MGIFGCCLKENTVSACESYLRYISAEIYRFAVTEYIFGAAGMVRHKKVLFDNFAFNIIQ